LEREDKVEGVKGVLEGVVGVGLFKHAKGQRLMPQDLPEGLDLDSIVDEWDRLKAAEEELVSDEASDSEVDQIPPDPKYILSTLSPAEAEYARRQALLAQYGYVDGDSPEPERPDGPARPAKTGDAKKEEEERLRLIQQAIRLDSKKKKYKKAQDGRYAVERLRSFAHTHSRPFRPKSESPKGSIHPAVRKRGCSEQGSVCQRERQGCIGEAEVSCQFHI
jgi:hypothetical protein